MYAYKYTCMYIYMYMDVYGCGWVNGEGCLQWDRSSSSLIVLRSRWSSAGNVFASDFNHKKNRKWFKFTINSIKLRLGCKNNEYEIDVKFGCCRGAHTPGNRRRRLRFVQLPLMEFGDSRVLQGGSVLVCSGDRKWEKGTVSFFRFVLQSEEFLVKIEI